MGNKNAYQSLKIDNYAQGKKSVEAPSRAERICPNCSNINEAEATFCAECGTLLQQPMKCPQCGTSAHPKADICEVCGAWLLEGQCMFCYAPVDAEDTFCGECGNPSAGIPCPRCSKKSIFDFCASCGIPLTLQAKEMAQEAAKNSVFKEMISSLSQLTTDDIVSSLVPELKDNAPNALDRNEGNEQASRLKDYRESITKSSAVSKTKQASNSLFSKAKKENISQLCKEVDEELERRRIEEERRQEEERKRRVAEEKRREKIRRMKEKFNEKMREFRTKTFSSSQEARRFYMNIISGFPDEVTKSLARNGVTKWRCNAYDCIHNSPSECGDPSRGGVWLIQ